MKSLREKMTCKGLRKKSERIRMRKARLYKKYYKYNNKKEKNNSPSNTSRKRRKDKRTSYLMNLNS